MAHFPGLTERHVAINKLLPELEKFFRETLGKEQLSEAANSKREEFLNRITSLNEPPKLPPRRNQGEDTQQDFISRQRELSRQREISRMKNDSGPSPSEPYGSQKRQLIEDGRRESIPSVSEDGSLLYEKISSESGSGKYVDIGNIEDDQLPPIPERSPHATLSRQPTEDREANRSSWKENLNDIYLQSLDKYSRNGPLTNLRTKTKFWYVLKAARLYIFRDFMQPCSQIINMLEYDVHVDSLKSFRLSKPGSPSLLLAAEDEEDHKQWITALEKCKYAEIDDIMPASFQRNQPSSGGNLVSDPDYEIPRDVIEQIKKNEGNDAPKSPLDVYVDMTGGERKTSGDYIDPSKRSPFYQSLTDLTYDEDLPPLPNLPDQDAAQENDQNLKAPNGFPPLHHSDENVSGSFDSLSSSSDEEAPPLPERKPRSNTEPIPYDVNDVSKNSLDRKKSNSLGRKQERDAFFNDAMALYVGILHQRRVLAVWQKRYCKVKNEILYVYRNPDNEERPALKINLHEIKIDLCDKETWRNHSFKITVPNAETMYFAAENREQLMTWLKILVQETDKFKFSGKEAAGRESRRSFLNPSDAIDSASTSSVERKEDKDGFDETISDSTASADSEASDQESQETGRKKTLKKRSSFKSVSEKKRSDIDIDGYLHLAKDGLWQRYWCKLKAKKIEIFNSKSSKSPENSLVLSESNLITLPKSVMGETNFYLFKLMWADDFATFLAKDESQWRKWLSLLKKYTKSKSEDTDLHQDLPSLPNSKRKGERRPLPKSQLTNGHMTPEEGSCTSQERKKYSGTLTQLKSVTDDTGNDVFCEIRDGIIILANDSAMEQKIVESPIRKLKLDEKEIGREDLYIFELKSASDVEVILAVKGKNNLYQFVEVLWLQNAQIDCEKGTIAAEYVKQLQKQHKRRSIVFDNELVDLETGGRLSLPKEHALTDQPESTASDGEQIRRLRKTSKQLAKSELRKSLKETRSGKQTASSRMSAFLRSLPRKKHKKYEFAASDTVDGMPKIQFNGNVKEVRTDESGVETLHDRHCKISGKIFYAYEPGSDIKPIFKVPLRNASIEETFDKETSRYIFALSSMEDRSTFKFSVSTEDEFDNWSHALYMIDVKSNPSGMSSRESLLDETKSDADIEINPEAASGVFSNSNSNSSLSSILSKQAKNLAGNVDDSKIEAPAPRKISEEVFLGAVENIRLNGFLFQVNITESNGVKSRTKIRRWCVLRQSWLEIYDNKLDKDPKRGFAIGHYSIESASVEDSGEKWAFAVKSDNELCYLCASNEEEFLKWQTEFKKVCKKSNRKSSDTAKLRLKSAGEGLLQLLSSSSLSGSSKRDSKRNTIVLNENDEKVVDNFTRDIESGNKISGVLTVISVNDKPTKPKKRFCSIRDGKFCIAKRAKPQKPIRTIDLSSIAILDECDIDKSIFRFRLDFAKNESMVFQTVDQQTADNWMVAISMAILLERLTSPDKFPQQGGKDEEIEDKDFDGPEVNDLGLIDVSPVIGRKKRGSEGSNLSSDIKVAIDRKISGGSNYLNPLSNLLESAFSPGPYSESSTPSSREGTLERNVKRRSGRIVSGDAIKEEDMENSGDHEHHEQDQQRDMEGENEGELPASGSVSKAISKYEKMLPGSKEPLDDNVFQNEAESSELELHLSELLKMQEDLEKERNVILSRLPDLRNGVEEAKIRRERASNSSESQICLEEYEIAKNDFEVMHKRLTEVEKKLRKVQAGLQKKRSKLKEPFRRRSAVISPHVIV